MYCTQCGCGDNRCKRNSLCRRCETLKQYNMTKIDYYERLSKQNYRCAICKSKSNGTKQHPYFAVDHCHKTNEVRGLLCSRCNQGIGLLKDSIENLSNAILYLENNAKTNNV